MATGGFNSLKKYKSIKEDNKVHIVESAITNIQQNLGYKIMLFTALKCHFLYKFPHTLHAKQPSTGHAAPHLMGRGKNYTKGMGAQTPKLGHLNPGSLPCSISGVQKSHTPTKCLRTNTQVFALLFTRARANHKTGSDELQHNSSSRACQLRPHTHIWACFVSCHTCQSSAKELQNPSLDSC